MRERSPPAITRESSARRALQGGGHLHLRIRQERFSKASRLVPPHAISSKCPPRPEEPISNKSLAVAVPPSQPRPQRGFLAVPLLTDTLRFPRCPRSRLKASDGAATAGGSRRPLASLLSLIRTSALPEQRAVFVFSSAFLTRAVFLRVRVRGL